MVELIHSDHLDLTIGLVFFCLILFIVISLISLCNKKKFAVANYKTISYLKKGGDILLIGLVIIYFFSYFKFHSQISKLHEDLDVIIQEIN